MYFSEFQKFTALPEVLRNENEEHKLKDLSKLILD